MSSNDDLKAHAASDQDFYALLDISPVATESELRRAYRRTALKYHPDKIANPTPADTDKFHFLQIAYDVLSDPSLRQLYDNAREARVRKQRERDTLDAANKKMVEDLEARERAGAQPKGVKRSWGDGDADEKFQREFERIAADGRRRRQEAEERLMREAEEEERLIQKEEEEARQAADKSSQRVDRSREGGGSNVPEAQRGVKVRWVREGRGSELDKERLEALFSPFGEIEHLIVGEDKRRRLDPREKKKLIATALVIFASIVSAHKAVSGSEKIIRQNAGQRDGDWNSIESVFWASGQAPDLGTGPPLSNQNATPSTSEPAKAPPKPSFGFPGSKTAGANGAGKPSGKAPSFSSFPSAGTTAPTTNNTSANPSGPSYREQVIMRLNNAQREKERAKELEKERKAQEELLRKEDEAADAAEAAAVESKC